jgi:lipopolysaccharide transport system ATP-binding protein
VAAPLLSAHGVGKRYELGVADDSGSLTHSLGEMVRARARRLRHPGASAKPEELWALRDVNFDLNPGDALGLVGRNGAGKSTLLKLLSRISLPTEGRITVRGRVATMLEVGTGFHPELTGRENIYLNGVILGMKRTEIDRHFDEMVEFSGIERFLDTAVKRYSSGMYVRLAFAVSAHLTPEILLVDEVLAVGDREFQRKCLAKMHEVANEGRAVIFVSHSLPSIQRLCTRALLIENGRVTMDDSVDSVVRQYIGKTTPQQDPESSAVPDDVERTGTGEARLRHVNMTSLSGEPLTQVFTGQPFRVKLQFEVFEPIEEAIFELGITTLEGEMLLTAHSSDGGRPPVRVEPGIREVSVEVNPTLLPHEFMLEAALHRASGMTVDHVQFAHSFTALNGDERGLDRYPWDLVRGYARLASSWSEVRDAESAAALP